MERLADFVVNNRIKMAFVTMLMAFAVYAGIPNLKLDTDGRVFMAADNPDKILLDRFEQEFAKDDNLAIVIVPKDGKVFTPRVLGAIGAMTEELWNLPYVRLVNSITRFQNTYADGDMMVVEDLVPEPSMVTDAEAAAALEKALADPMIAASSSAEALAADAAAQRALAAEARTLQVTLVPSGPWVESVFGASRVVSIKGDAPLGDLLGGVDEAARLRLIDSEGRALNREWTPTAAGVEDGVTLLVAENDRRNLRQRRPDTYQTPAEAAQRRGSVLDAIRRRVTPTAPLDPAYVIDARDEATLYQNARAGRAAARAIRGNRAAWDTYTRRRAAPADGDCLVPCCTIL